MKRWELFELDEGNMLGITHSDGMFLVYDIASGEMRAH